jgi:hypothetical protein
MSSDTVRAIAPTAESGSGSSSLTGAIASVIVFGLLMAAVFALPTNNRDDAWTRNTVRVSLVFYALAEGAALAGRVPALVRLWWSLGWLGYLIHLWVAFQVYHHGSHAEAVEHVREAAGIGSGIFVSHFFTLVWTLDVAARWLMPGWRAQWPAWALGLLHGFMAFIVFCATVVYETGPIRWVGLGMFVALAAIGLTMRRSPRAL